MDKRDNPVSEKKSGFLVDLGGLLLAYVIPVVVLAAACGIIFLLGKWVGAISVSIVLAAMMVTVGLFRVAKAIEQFVESEDEHVFEGEEGEAEDDPVPEGEAEENT